MFDCASVSARFVEMVDLPSPGTDEDTTITRGGLSGFMNCRLVRSSLKDSVMRKRSRRSLEPTSPASASSRASSARVAPSSSGFLTPLRTSGTEASTGALTRSSSAEADLMRRSRMVRRAAMPRPTARPAARPTSRARGMFGENGAEGLVASTSCCTLMMDDFEPPSVTPFSSTDVPPFSTRSTSSASPFTHALESAAAASGVGATTSTCIWAVSLGTVTETELSARAGVTSRPECLTAFSATAEDLASCSYCTAFDLARLSAVNATPRFSLDPAVTTAVVVALYVLGCMRAHPAARRTPTRAEARIVFQWFRRSWITSRTGEEVCSPGVGFSVAGGF